MSSKRKGGVRSRSPLTKTQLLPMSPALARERSLAYHLALASWRTGHGYPRSVNELIHAAYIAWYVHCAGYGEEPIENFKIIEFAVESTLAADDAGSWTLDPDAVSAFESVLALSDRQLASVPQYRFDDAERQLAAFLRGTERSPIPMPINVMTSEQPVFPNL